MPAGLRFAQVYPERARRARYAQPQLVTYHKDILVTPHALEKPFDGGSTGYISGALYEAGFLIPHSQRLSGGGDR